MTWLLSIILLKKKDDALVHIPNEHGKPRQKSDQKFFYMAKVFVFTNYKEKYANGRSLHSWWQVNGPTEIK